MILKSKGDDDGHGPALRPGQKALVTGAGSGIGCAIALALAAEGLEVLLVGRDIRKLREVARLSHSATRILAADVTTRRGLSAVARATRPVLDILVHSAGGYLRSPVESTSPEAWATLDAINLHAPILLTSACLPQLRAAKGQVVFINSTAGLRSDSGMAAYAAGKHGLKAAADALRQEVNADGIRVLSIFPGRTDTPMQNAVLAAEGRMAPPGTLMLSEDVASLILAALKLPRTAEVTDIVMRPMRPLPSARLGGPREQARVAQRRRRRSD